MSTTPWPVFDGHNDTVLQLYRPWEGKERSFFEHSAHGHIDLPRAKRGGFGGGFFSIFVPPEPGSLPGPPGSLMVTTETGYEIPPFPQVDYGYALTTARDMTGVLFQLEAESEGGLKVVRTSTELADCIGQSAIAAVLHFEGAEAMGVDLVELETFYKMGLRSLGPVWSRPNAFAHGVPFKFPHSPDIGPGLTEAGKELVKACYRLGILVDLAHINLKGFWGVEAIADAPLVVTHACAHAICPSTRNLTDDQLLAIKQTGGMVGVNFNVRDLRPDGRTELDTPLAEIVKHFVYLVETMGIDHVGFGSDFDGTNVSNELKDVAGLPKLTDALQDAGFDHSEMEKLTHKNWLRVLAQTWKS